MVKKVETQFFEMGFHLLSGIIVDKELADKLQVVLEEARKKVCQLLDENKEHLKESSDHTVYPFGIIDLNRFVYVNVSCRFFGGAKVHEYLIFNASAGVSGEFSSFFVIEGGNSLYQSDSSH